MCRHPGARTLINPRGPFERWSIEERRRVIDMLSTKGTSLEKALSQSTESICEIDCRFESGGVWKGRVPVEDFLSDLSPCAWGGRFQSEQGRSMPTRTPSAATRRHASFANLTWCCTLYWVGPYPSLGGRRAAVRSEEWFSRHQNPGFSASSESSTRCWQGDRFWGGVCSI